jgi:hypothetical protein
MTQTLIEFWFWFGLFIGHSFMRSRKCITFVAIAAFH